MRVKLYLRSRHVGVAVAVMAGLAAIAVAVGGRLFTVVSSAEPVTMPYRHALVMFCAVVAVASLESPVPGTDRADTGPLRSARRAHLLALLVVTVVLSAMSEAFAAVGTPAQAIRASLCWYGLALVSATVVRAAFAWVLPMVALFLLVWWGNAGGGPAVWNWATAAAAEPVSWVVAVASLALGSVVSLLRQ
ncbi:MAG: hypothetical protein FWE61_08605 [Micrococcales bacterium]|nr:hypothetical protein [Micrococcales bacterium]